MRSRLLAGLLACLALLAGSPARAQIGEISPGELALAPEFCQDVQMINGWSQFANPSPRSPYWVSLMGMTFWGMHHYCFAVVNLHRAAQAGTPPRIREWRIRDAINDFMFVVNRAPRDFILLPEIHHRIADAYVLLEDYGKAVDHYRIARELKPDYWPPYLGEAKLLIKANRRKDAAQMLEQGLALIPDEPNLTAALKDLRDPKSR